MAFKVIVKADNVDPQIKALMRFEAFAQEHYKKAMQQVINPTKSAVKSAAPKRSGALRKGIGSKITGGNGLSVVGRVTNGKDTWYGNVIEYGRRLTNKQPPVEAIAAKYDVPVREAFLIARAIARKGSNARKPVEFFKGAREKAFKDAERAFEAANIKIVDEMSVK